MVVAGVFEAIDGGDEVGALLASAAITAGIGVLLWRGTRLPRRVSAASAFTAVAWTWTVASLAGALPFALAGIFDHLDDAIFESVAGFTTTSSTLFTSPEAVSDGLVLWRGMLQWIGGIAAVVLAVAVLPLLGVGGLEVVRAEAPGPEPERLPLWVAQTARRMTWIYAGITAVVVVGLLAAGAGVFDAVTHAFGAVSTGGFSSRDGSVGAFSSVAVEAVLIVGMLGGAMSFTLHWRVLHGERRAYRRSRQLHAFLVWLAAAIGFVTVVTVLEGGAVVRSLRHAGFAVVSLATTTGFQTADFAAWAPAVQLVLLLVLLTGAMTGSASGGMKLFRLQVVFSYARRELRRARHPRGLFPLRLGGMVVRETVVAMIAGFVAIYLLVFLLGVLVLAALGSDLLTALGASGSALGNVGPGPGDVGTTAGYASLSRPAHASLSVLMLVGRLEILPLLLALAAPSRALARRRRAGRPPDAREARAV